MAVPEEELAFVRNTIGIVGTEYDDLIREYWNMGYRSLALVHVVRVVVIGSGRELT